MLLQALPFVTLTGAALAADLGSFSNPSSQSRPRFRYWIPDASVDLDSVAADIKSAGDVGAGGVELLGYYWYGDQSGEVVATDWTKYTWGTTAWKNLQDTALQTCVDEGLLMDFSLGPNQGAGVPAPADDEGLKWDVAPFNVSVPIGGSFDDVLPGWGSGKLIASSVGTVVDSVDTDDGKQDTLDISSLADITGQVDSNGRVTVHFNDSSDGLEHRVFAYYLLQPLNHELPPSDQLTTTVPQSPITNYVENGSYVVDHFSARGAKTIIDFWENQLLGGGSKELLAQAGNYGWEDSQEFSIWTSLWWTPQLPEFFSKARGYDVAKYIPILVGQNNGNFGPAVTSTIYVTNEDDAGQSYMDDFRQTLTELNQEYLTELTNWLVDSLQCEFSAQVVYNLEMDMLANIPYVNAPETESLGFNHIIDAYLQYSGPANLAGKQIISTELGAVPDLVYQQTIPELVWEIDRSLVGNINQFVIHGLPFGGQYPECTWPGFITFSWHFSEMYGPRQPAWDYWGDFLNWTARNQFIFQSSIPKVDVAFWLKNESYEYPDVKYIPDDLVSAGFTYQYLSPDNFDLPEARVEDSVLAPDSQAFQVLILRSNDTLTPSGAKHLLEYAEQGLPIVFSGGMPTRLGGHYTSSVASEINSTMTKVSEHPNAHVVPLEGLSSSLISLGLQPRASVQSNGTWYVNTRSGTNDNTEYLFVYSDGSSYLQGEGQSTGSVTVKTTGNPFVYDTWTGETSPLYVFARNASTVTIPLVLAGNQSLSFAFTQDGGSAESLVDSLPSGISTAPDSQNSCSAQLRSINSDETTVKLNNGTTVTLPAAASSPIIPSQWNLTVEAWTAPDDFNNTAAATVKTNSTYTLSELIPWNEIDMPDAPLQNVSGRGYYSTQFTWPPEDTDGLAGAIIDLGYILQTARASLNGHALPPLDPAHATADLGPYLRAGANQLDVVVATPLSNSLRTVWDDQFCGGKSPVTESVPAPESQPYGLLAEVAIVPYAAVQVEVAGCA